MTQLEGQSVTGYRISIPMVPLSPNALLGKHWSAKAKEKQAWMMEITVAMPKQPAIAKCRMYPQGKMRVTITIHNSRQYDRDNAYGSVKPILDAMKALGLIVDDRAQWCDLTVLQEKSTRKDKHTEILVEPCNV